MSFFMSWLLCRWLPTSERESVRPRSKVAKRWPLTANGAKCNTRPRHPGLDPGSTTSTPRWIPDQVRDAEKRELRLNRPRSEERREGKSVSVRVDLGGRRVIKKKNNSQK